MAMTDFPHQERHPIAPAAKDEEQTGRVTRRTVLVGAAAATAAATIAVDTPARAHSVDANSPEDMVAFVLLSGALTGIAETKLAPGSSSFPPPPASPTPAPPAPVDLQKSSPGSDPVNIKRDYFNWVNERHPAAFENLLRVVREAAGKSFVASDRAQAIIDTVQFKDEDDDKRTPSELDAKYLARSIVLMWYLGAWYDPNVLRMRDSTPFDFIVISPKAYTQAWTLRVAQAHPMGFSEMQFGYWTREPNKLSDFTGKA